MWTHSTRISLFHQASETSAVVIGLQGANVSIDNTVFNTNVGFTVRTIPLCYVLSVPDLARALTHTLFSTPQYHCRVKSWVSSAPRFPYPILVSVTLNLVLSFLWTIPRQRQPRRTLWRMMFNQGFAMHQEIDYSRKIRVLRVSKAVPAKESVKY